MSLAQEHEKRLEWAVDVLRETPVLPENFLSNFEEKLALEPEAAPVTNLVVALHPTKGGVSSKQSPQWVAGLVAALLMLCALAGFLGKPKTQVVAVKPTGLFVVAGAQKVKINETPITTVTELDTKSLLETGHESVVLMAGKPGNEIKVGPKSRVGVLIPDSVDAKEHRSELQLASGSVFISETEAKVSVRTAHALIAPVGTDYRVMKSASSTEITVLDGSVNVEPPQGGQGIRLKAGQRMTVGENADWKRIRVKVLPPSGLAPLQSTRKEMRRLKTRPEIGTGLKAYPKAKARPKTRKPEPIVRQTSYPQAQVTPLPGVQRPTQNPGFQRPARTQAATRTRARVRPQARRTSLGNVKYPVRRQANQARRQAVQINRPTRPRAQRPNYQNTKGIRKRPVGNRTSSTGVNRRRDSRAQVRKGTPRAKTRANRGTRVRRGGRRR